MATQELVKLQAPKKVYEPDLGDVLWDAKKWLAKVPPPPWTADRWDIIRLEYIHENPERALQLLSISAGYLSRGSVYRCPYTKTWYCGIVPNAIFSKDPEQYREKVVAAYGPNPVALDFDWHRHMHLRPEDEPSDIQRLLLGSGYTAGTRKCDGHGEIKTGYCCLSNGDMLRVNFWEWYNK